MSQIQHRPPIETPLVGTDIIPVVRDSKLYRGTLQDVWSGGLTPYYIGPDEVFLVPLYKQVLFANTIEVDGTLTVQGRLILVD